MEVSGGQGPVCLALLFSVGGPAGVDFDLYLWKWNGSSWVTVAQGTSSAPDEDVSYNGTAGYYVWRVESYSGGGNYAFGMQRP